MHAQCIKAGQYPPWRLPASLVDKAMHDVRPLSKLFQPPTGSAGMTGLLVDATPISHHTAHPPKQLQLGNSCSQGQERRRVGVGRRHLHTLPTCRCRRPYIGIQQINSRRPALSLSQLERAPCYPRGHARPSANEGYGHCVSATNNITVSVLGIYIHIYTTRCRLRSTAGR